MKKIILVNLLIISSLSTNFAFAEAANTGIIVGGNLGYATVETPDLSNTLTQSDDHFNWGGYVGMNFAVTSNFMLGFQTGYNNYGSTKYSGSGGSIELSTSSWDLLATSTYVFDNGINFFGKMGIARVDETGDFKVHGFNDSGDNIASRPEIGIGAGYMLSNLNFSLEYRHIFADDQNTSVGLRGVPSVNAYMFGISYQFNF